MENEQRRRLEQAAHADNIDPAKAKLVQKKQQVKYIKFIYKYIKHKCILYVFIIKYEM